MTMTPGMFTFDTTDAVRLAGWWAEQTGGRAAEETFGGTYVMVTGGPVVLAFQQVPDPTPGKNKVHLDEHFHWVTLADPDGNQFCVAAAADTAGLG